MSSTAGCVTLRSPVAGTTPPDRPLLQSAPVPRLLRFWLTAVLLAAAAPALPATLRATSIEETARASDSVLRGRVAALASRWQGGRIVTEVEIEVVAAWKGAPGERVRVLVPGGAVGEIGQWVEGAPAFEEREEVVVFLRRRGPSWRLSGLALGKYRVEDGLARPDLRGVRFERRPLPAGERAAGAVRLEELERRVRGAR